MQSYSISATLTNICQRKKRISQSVFPNEHTEIQIRPAPASAGREVTFLIDYTPVVCGDISKVYGHSRYDDCNDSECRRGDTPKVCGAFPLHIGVISGRPAVTRLTVIAVTECTVTRVKQVVPVYNDRDYREGFIAIITYIKERTTTALGNIPSLKSPEQKHVVVDIPNSPSSEGMPLGSLGDESSAV